MFFNFVELIYRWTLDALHFTFFKHAHPVLTVPIVRKLVNSQLVAPGEPHEFSMPEAAYDEIFNLGATGDIYVAAVMGVSRVGKSLLLNLFVRWLVQENWASLMSEDQAVALGPHNVYDSPFVTSNTQNACTQGMDYLLLRRREGGYYLVIDVEGTSNGDVRNHQRLLGLARPVTSTLVFIEKDAINRAIRELASLVGHCECLSAAPNAPRFPWPRLLFTLNKRTEAITDGDENAYFERSLEATEHDEAANPDRQAIRQCFVDRSFVSIPSTERVARREATAREMLNRRSTSEFATSFKSFATELRRLLEISPMEHVGTDGTVPMTGPVLAEHFRQLVNLSREQPNLPPVPTSYGNLIASICERISSYVLLFFYNSALSQQMLVANMDGRLDKESVVSVLNTIQNQSLALYDLQTESYNCSKCTELRIQLNNIFVRHLNMCVSMNESKKAVVRSCLETITTRTKREEKLVKVTRDENAYKVYYTKVFEIFQTFRTDYRTKNVLVNGDITYTDRKQGITITETLGTREETSDEVKGGFRVAEVVVSAAATFGAAVLTGGASVIVQAAILGAAAGTVSAVSGGVFVTASGSTDILSPHKQSHPTSTTSTSNETYTSTDDSSTDKTTGGNEQQSDATADERASTVPTHHTNATTGHGSRQPAAVGDTGGAAVTSNSTLSDTTNSNTNTNASNGRGDGETIRHMWVIRRNLDNIQVRVGTLAHSGLLVETTSGQKVIIEYMLREGSNPLNGVGYVRHYAADESSGFANPDTSTADFVLFRGEPNKIDHIWSRQLRGDNVSAANTMTVDQASRYAEEFMKGEFKLLNHWNCHKMQDHLRDALLGRR